MSLITSFVLLQDECLSQLPDYQLKLLTEQQGLQPAEFISMARDSQGFLWLLSPNKVQRYDGLHAWSFPVPPHAHSIFVDRGNQIWLLSRHHLHRFKNNYHGFHPVLESGDTSNIICLFYARDQLFLLRSDQCQVFDEKVQRFVMQQQLVLPTQKRLSSVYTYNQDYLFVASADSVFSLQLQNYQWRSTAFNRIAVLTALSGNHVIGSNTQLKSFALAPGETSIKEITSGQFKPALQNDFIRIYSGIHLGKNTFHLSTNQGLWHYDAATSHFTEPIFYHRGEKVTNMRSVRTLYRDAMGTVFMTTGDGVALYHPDHQGIQYVRNYHLDGYSLPDTDIRSFTEDQHGQLWIATLSGIARINTSSGELTTFLAGEENSINYPSIRHLLFYHDKLWVGTSGRGIWMYSETTSGFERPVLYPDTTASRLEKEFIWRMVPLVNGDLFVAGGGSCYVINQDRQVRRLPDEIYSGISRSAIQDSSGRIWHGTSSGLNCTNDEYELLFRLDTMFPDRRIAAFCEWEKNRMLIGTMGLYEANCDRANHVTVHQRKGFPSNRFVYAMEKDAYGQIWIGTDEGLYRYDPVKDQSQSFGQADHVQMQSFNSNGLYISSTGLVYAGGKGGMNYFDPRFLDTRPFLLRPVIAAFNIADDDSTYFLSSSPIDVPYLHRNISVEISVPDFIYSAGLQYRYRSQSDQEWISNGNSRFLQLHHYGPDEYNLTVAASHDGVHWYESQPLAFVILPPWWQRWYSVLSFILLFCIATYAVLQGIQRRKERKRQHAVIDYFAKSTYGDNDVDHILWDITRNCISRLGFEECVIYLLDSKRQVLVQKAAYGPKSPRQFEVVDPIEIPLGTGITGTVARTGKAEIVNDTSKDPRYVIDDEARKSEITVPIIHEGKVIGIIDSENSRKHFFTAGHLQTLTTIAGICAVKVARGLSLAEMKKAEAMVQEISTKMMETRYQNLRLQMNPHFLFNCLSSIQHLVVSQQTKEAYSYLSIFSHFLRSILQYADKNVITLEEELKMIDMYIQLERLGSDKEFTFTLEVDESLDVEDVLIPPLLVQPVIENAIWHGLMPKEGERLLAVRFSNVDDNAIACTVDDIGI